MPSFNASTAAPTTRRNSRRHRRQRRGRRTNSINDTPIRGIFDILGQSKKEAAEYLAKIEQHFEHWRERTAGQIINEEELAEIRARVDSAQMYHRVCNNLLNLLSTCLENRDYSILAFDLMTQMLELRKFVREHPVPEVEDAEVDSEEEEYFAKLRAMDANEDEVATSNDDDSEDDIDADNRSYTSTERELLQNYYRYRPGCYDSDSSDLGTYSYNEQERQLVRRLVRRDRRRQRTMALLNNMSQNDELSAIDEERADIARQRRHLQEERETLTREIEELRRQREEIDFEEQMRMEEEEEEAEEEPRRLTREALEEHDRLQRGEREVQQYNLRPRNNNIRYSESAISEYTIHAASTVIFDVDYDETMTTRHFDDVISISDEDEEEEEDVPETCHTSKAYAPGKRLVTIENLRLCSRVDEERRNVPKVSDLQWPVGVMPGIDEEQEELDRRYFAEMTNNEKCANADFTNEDLTDPLTLAASMLRECPLCTKEKAGFNIVYTRTCQHHVCRKCLLKLAIVAQRERRDITCPICRTQINEIFGFTRGQGKRGRLTFYSCVPTPCLSQNVHL